MMLQSGIRRPVLSGVTYRVTNECLPAVTLGMNVKAQDSILAIAGSGDQAFALLEHTRHVSVADWNPAQLEYIRQRVNALREGDWEGFFKPWSQASLDVRESAVYNYFNHQKRLETIARNINSLQVLESSDFITALASFPCNTFNKIYCSNAFVDRSKFGKIGEYIPNGGLVYNACGEKSARPIVVRTGGRLVIDGDLTKKARDSEESYVHGHYFKWSPVVFVKEA
jgi:hypothetical protein